MHRARDRAPAGAAGDQPGIFPRQDQVAEGKGLAVVLEGVEQRQQVEDRAARAATDRAATAASAPTLGDFDQAEQPQEAVLAERLPPGLALGVEARLDLRRRSPRAEQRAPEHHDARCAG